MRADIDGARPAGGDVELIRPRFVLDADPRGELAGRDVVARAIWDELGRSGERCVYLDCSPLGARAAMRLARAPCFGLTLPRAAI